MVPYDPVWSHMVPYGPLGSIALLSPVRYQILANIESFVFLFSNWSTKNMLYHNLLTKKPAVFCLAHQKHVISLKSLVEIFFLQLFITRKFRP